MKNNSNSGCTSDPIASILRTIGLVGPAATGFVGWIT